MGSSIYKPVAYGHGGPVSEHADVPVGQSYRLISVTTTFTVAPTTSENLTITLDANAGARWDSILYTVDPGGAAVDSIVWQPEEELFLEGGDSVLVEYANTDARDWGIQWTFKAVP